jgi:hypothetical protein
MLSLKSESVSYRLTRYALLSAICLAGAGSALGQISTSTNASLAPSPVDQGTTPVATVTVTTSDGSSPDSSVTCAIQARGHNASYSSTLQGGVASISLLSIAQDPVGNYTLACSYAGSSNYAASSANTISFSIISPVSTTTTVSVAPSSVTFGSSPVATVTVTASNGSVPTGSVSCNIQTRAHEASYSSALTNGSASLALTSIAQDPVGTYSLVCSYAGSSSYTASSSSTISLNVTQAVPVITWSSPASIAAGTALSATQLDATASVAGTFTYNPTAGTVPAPGTDPLSVTFTPTDSTDYTPATASVNLTVGQVTPVLTWATPAPITYGTALSGTQFNATASVPGTFVYSPALGTIPAAGSDTLSVTFTPTNTTEYSAVTSSVSLTVNQATPAITWATPAAIAYDTALSATQLDATASVAGTFVYTPAAGTVPAAGTDTLSVTFTPTDTRDYASNSDQVSLSVIQPSTTQLSLVLSPSTVASGYPTVAQLAVTSSNGIVPAGNIACTGPGITSPPAAAINTSTGTVGIVLGSTTLPGSFPVGVDTVQCSFVPTSSSVTGSQATGTLTVTVPVQTGSISAGLSMSSPRYAHSATGLADGTILIAGGTNSEYGDSGALSSADIYNPIANTLVTKEMFSDRVFHTATLLNDGTVLVAGGQNFSQGVLSLAEIYNPVADAMSFSPAQNNLLAPRTMHTATKLNDGSVLIAGGLTESGQGTFQTSTFERYTLSNGFSSAGTIITPRYAHTATLLQDGTVLIVGGIDSSANASSSAELYDPSTGKSTSVGNLGTARYSHTATLLPGPSGIVLIAGGADKNASPIQSTELYNPATQSFSYGTALQAGRIKPTASLLPNGYVWIAGGLNSSGQSLQSSETYRPNATSGDTTVVDVTLDAPRAFHDATTIPSGAVILSGGYSGATVLASTDEYTFNQVSGSMNPKYLILGVFYAPPGSKSNVNYQNNTSVGTTSTLSSTFANTVGYSVAIEGGINILTFASGVTGTNSYNYTQQSSSSHMVTINKTASATDEVTGPTSDAAGIDHDYDIFAVWLNPMVNLSFVSPNSVLWNGYSVNPADPEGQLGQPDVLFLTAGQLKNPQTIGTYDQEALQRSWDTTGLGGMLSSDYANILALDPFVANPGYDPSVPDPTTNLYRYSLDTNGPPWQYATGVTQAYTQGSTTTVTNQTGGMDTYQLGFSLSATTDVGAFDGDFLGASGKVTVTATNTTTWTDTQTNSKATGTGSQASVTIVGPASTAGYSGPGQLVVWQDMLYNTFMFTYAPYASALSIQLQSSSIAYGSSLGVQVTASSIYGVPNGTVTCSGPGANSVSGTVTSGAGSVSLSGLSVGADTITCHFSGTIAGVAAGFTDSTAAAQVTVQ